MNRRVRSLFPLALTLAALNASAQQPKPSVDQSQLTGTITGRVLCSDTRSPARLATVLTIPIPVFDASGNATLPQVNHYDIVQTNLDGEYSLQKIAPGDYFVLSEMQGYLSPVAQFQYDQLKNLTSDAIKTLAKQLPSVHVEAAKTAHADVVLDRGASISGKVTYDDGSPAIGVYVNIELAQDASPQDRHLIDGLVPHWSITTDDHGLYRMSGLPEGEYVVESSMDSTQPMNHPLANADFEPNPDRAYGEMLDTAYSPSTLHRKDAKVYKLNPNEDLSDADVEIPLHTLYTISGTVTAQENLPPIVSGSVSLEGLDDKTFTRKAMIHSNGTFQLPYIPPGKYELKTAGVSDQSPLHSFSYERKHGYPYSKASIAVEVIDADLTSVTLAIPQATITASAVAR